MTTPSRILWDLAGQPDPPKGTAQPGADRPCAICGLKHDTVATRLPDARQEPRSCQNGR
jgi:hypothetical protein